MIDRTLAHYRITASIGSGGMGDVYRATDTKLGRDVALKILPAEMAGNPERLERFQREAKALPVPAEQLLAIGAALVDALSAAHEKGIVHRDLKPANVMVGSNGRVKVLDFGLASRRPLEEAGSEQTAAHDPMATVDAPLTELGMVMGTVPYMSPEQVQGMTVDHRSDLFSFGVILSEMAAGRRPFRGHSSAELISSILRDPPPAVADVRSDLPHELDRLIGRCLEKDRDRRVQTANEVRDALAALQNRKLQSSVGAVDPSASNRRSIVVLPFANLSPDPDNEYFSDGLTEEIIADLSKVRALRVISRTSAMQLKGAKKDVQTIGRELGVRYVLEGGVRKAGNSLRITAQLIDALTDAHLWSDKYSGTIDDVFEVQERVSREIVRALDVKLTSDEHRRLAERPIADARAFELYLQARQEVHRMSADALERASRLLEQAVAIEGLTPPLQALMAWALVTSVRLGIHRDRTPLDEAEVEARALLKSAPDSPDGHALLGYIEYERGHLPSAVRHFARALEKEPNDADALFYTGISYIAAGQNEPARATADRMVASDPLSPLSWMLSGATFWFIGRFDQALPAMERGLELDPHNFVLRWTAGYTRAALGHLADASRDAAFLHEVGPDVPYTRQLLALLDGLQGKKETARERLSSIDVTPLDAHNKFHLAESFGLAGETDRALDVLEMAVDQGFYPYPFMSEHCPFLAALRPLPRFEGILGKAQARVEAFNESVNQRTRG